MSDPTPPADDTAMRLHAVQFGDGSMYRCGFPTAMEAESFRRNQFGHGAVGPIGKIIPVVMVPEAEHVERLALIRDLYAELQEIDFPEHGGRRPFFDQRDTKLENRIRKAIGLAEIPPPPPPFRLTAEQCDPGHFARVCEEIVGPYAHGVAIEIDGTLARRFAIQR